MEAHEFLITSKNEVIKTPDEYEKSINAKEKVNILAEERPVTNKKSVFPDFTVDTTVYRFDREEANER